MIGNVQVTLNDKGSSFYDIKFLRAWNHIQLMESAKKIVEQSDAFIFGSLVARDETVLAESPQTLEAYKTLHELFVNSSFN